MLGDLAKAVAYAKAPKLTFAMLHPRKAIQLRKVPFDLRTAYAPRLSALVALLIAFPLGVAVGIHIARGPDVPRRAPRTARSREHRRARHGPQRESAGQNARRPYTRFVSPPLEAEPPPTFV